MARIVANTQILKYPVMRRLLILFFLLTATASFSQDLLMDTEDVHESDVLDAKFNGGGLDKFYEFINKEFDFSKVTKPGKLITSFTINVSGEIKNIRILKFPNDEAAAEIIRVLQKAPKWEPAKRAGKPISIEIKIPLDFKTK